MLDALYTLSPYAPVVIFVAATLDIFFVTGLILYGAAMLGLIAMMHTTGMITLEGIVVSAYAGTMLGNVLNYGAGRLFGEVPIVARKLQHPKLETGRAFLKTRGLFLFIIVCRFIAVTRPLYALLIGSLEISFRRFFLYEAFVALAWIIFWLIILVQGEMIYAWLFG